MTTMKTNYEADVLRAEVAGQDLQEGPYGLHVCAMRRDERLYELGHVSETLVYQNPQAAHAAISRIKFGVARHEHLPQAK